MRHVLSHILRLILTMTILVVATPTHAQQNPYKISDKLYPLYEKAYNNRRNQQGLALADSLCKRAIAMGDKKAEVLGLLIYVQYELQTPRNYPALLKACEKVREKAKKYDLMQYYFYCTITQATYLSNEERDDEAMKLLKEDTRLAEKTGHPYGIQMGYVSMGNILMAKNEYGHGVRFYQRALNFVKEHMPEKARSSVYPKLATAFFYMGKFDESLTCIDEGLKYSYTNSNRATLLTTKALVLFIQGAYKDFRQTRQDIRKYSGVANNLTNVENSLYQSFDLMEDGKFEQATAIIAKLPDFLRKYANYAYFLKRHDYKQASASLHDISKNLMGNNRDDFMQDFDELSHSYSEQINNIERQQAINEQAKLKLKLMQLQLLNTNQELSHADNMKRLQQIYADKNALAVHNQRLKSAQLRDSLSSQKAVDKKIKERKESLRKILIGVSAFILTIIILTIVYLWQHRKMQQRLYWLSLKLKSTLDELNIANDQAQKSDKAKTRFIQDMSHEIRTPLNAIVGFSQVLSETDYHLSAEEKTDITKRITENSEMLSTLINDILDLTSIESGKYVMNIEPATVNALCQEALNSVRHRLADGVELRYTSDVSDGQTVNTDIMRTQQVLNHLLVNAAKNTTEGSITLDCSLTKNPGLVTFTVTDTGIGVPSEKMQQIFERFKKVDYFKQGSGLGLEISSTIARCLGGSVSINPAYTTGAQFSFTISDSLQARK